MNLGSCCSCGRVGPDVRNVILMDREAPEGTVGWSCLVCGLPPRGATAVVCDECLDPPQPIRFLCGGKYASEGVRVPIDQVTLVIFKHDDAKHAGDEHPRSQLDMLGGRVQ